MLNVNAVVKHLEKIGKNLIYWLAFQIGAVLFALLIIGFLASLALAHHHPKHAEIHNEMERITQWIADHTEYEYIDPPAVYFVPQSHIDYVWLNSQDGYNGESTGTIAIYVGHLMVLNENFDLETEKYVLAHELVHHLQYVHGREFACIALAEREAYMIQNKYADEFSGEKTNNMFLYFLRCNPHK